MNNITIYELDIKSTKCRVNGHRVTIEKSKIQKVPEYRLKYGAVFSGTLDGVPAKFSVERNFLSELHLSKV